MLLNLFLAAAAVLWSTVFGYVAVLLVLAARRRLFRPEQPATGDAELPRIAVVVPVRNEEKYITAKLANIRRTDYPPDRITTIVVDGGSTDGTARLVEAARASGDAAELVRVDHARGKSDQLNAVLARLSQEFIVVTDADAELDPSCVRSLVDALRSSPATDIVGARVRPATRLVEERIHWWLLNSLWWLEGEALGNGQFSGVCYAIRPSAVATLPSDCDAEDIRFGLLASARGRDVRICRRAIAVELRVPQTMREFVTFRRRRGSSYLAELRRTRPSSAPPRWHFVQALRLYHFFVMPILAAAVAVAGLALLATPDWRWPLAAGSAFVVPAAAALFASTTLADSRRSWRLGIAAGRMAGLTWCSLVALPRTAATRLAKGD